MNISSLWNKYLYGGLDSKNSDNANATEVLFINIFSLIGISALLIFGFVNVVQDNVIVGGFELLMGIISIINLVALRMHKKASIASTVILASMLVVIALLLYTGGYRGTGIFWAYTYPLLAFFLKGTKRGKYWFGAAMAMAIGIWLLRYAGAAAVFYTDEQLHQFLFSIIAVAIIVHYNQHLREKGFARLTEMGQNFSLANSRLEQELANVEPIKRRLAESAQEAQDTKKAVLNILEDLSEEKQKLAQAKAKDEAILENLAEGLVVVDKNAKFLVFNDRAKEILGTGPTEESPERWPRIYGMYSSKDEKMIAIQDFSLMRAMRGETVLGEEILIKNSTSPQGVYIRINAGPIMVGDAIEGVVFTFVDMTKERQVDKAKTEFVSLASHQLRTPLSAINWYSEMLLAGDAGPLNDEQKKFIEEVAVGNKRMVELVDALLNTSRLELGTFIIEPKPIDTVSLVKSVLGELKSDITKKKQVVTETVDESISRFPADEKLLRMVVQNLISNAVKYTPEGGTIAVEMSVGKLGHQIDGKALDEDSLIFSVADSGIGIPAGQQDKIFSKLFRADNAKESETEGTGLGLYIIKSIVEQSGGAVWFESKEKQGTTFYVTFPLSGMKAKAGAKKLN